MATYPTGVYAPASKSAGQTIQASFFNDPEAEITAIEDALKNGIPHAITISTGGLTVSTGGLRVGGPSTLAALQAGASTLTTLSAGASTLTTLQAGNSTVTGDLSVSGVLTVGGIAVGGRQPSAKVSLAANVNINASIWTAVNWTTNDHDSTSLHSTTTNSSRVNLTSSGLWLLGGQASWTPGTPASTTILGVRLVLNDADAIGGQRQFLGTPSATDWSIQSQALYYATSTTAYVSMHVFQSGGSQMQLNGSTGTGTGPTQFYVQKVSA